MTGKIKQAPRKDAGLAMVERAGRLESCIVEAIAMLADKDKSAPLRAHLVKAIGYDPARTQ